MRVLSLMGFLVWISAYDLIRAMGSVATRDDDNVVVGEFLVGLLEGHVGLERDALRRGDEVRVTDEGNFESLAFCERIDQLLSSWRGLYGST
jgi:hypothetical protein